MWAVVWDERMLRAYSSKRDAEEWRVPNQQVVPMIAVSEADWRALHELFGIVGGMCQDGFVCYSLLTKSRLDECDQAIQKARAIIQRVEEGNA